MLNKYYSFICATLLIITPVQSKAFSSDTGHIAGLIWNTLSVPITTLQLVWTYRSAKQLHQIKKYNSHHLNQTARQELDTHLLFLCSSIAFSIYNLSNRPNHWWINLLKGAACINAIGGAGILGYRILDACNVLPSTIEKNPYDDED